MDRLEYVKEGKGASKGRHLGGPQGFPGLVSKVNGGDIN